VNISEELIGRAWELQPILASRAPACEKRRAPLDETIRAICDAGFVEMLVPRRLGGHELDIATACEVSRILATGCPSTAWVTAFYIEHNWQNILFPAQFHADVFAAGPRVLTAAQIAPTIKARRVTGGFEISGRSSWSSGVTHAHWIAMTGLVTAQDRPPVPLLFAVPRAQVSIVDNWFIAGMQGTGSMDVVVEKTYIPEHHVLPISTVLNGANPDQLVDRNPLYLLPAMLALSLITVAVLVGMARGAADFFLQKSKDRVGTNTGARFALKSSAQARIGTAVAGVEVLEGLLRDSVASLSRYSRDLRPTVEDRVRMQTRVALMAKGAGDLVNDIAQGAGGNAFRDDAPLQRFFRDVNVARAHAAFDLSAATEAYGAALLGIAGNTTQPA
jgi:3-hydroxy-9,10-secoandrosta-1,3,5(10)-triene-9,17-dione monooxygenase